VFQNSATYGEYAKFSSHQSIDETPPKAPRSFWRCVSIATLSASSLLDEPTHDTNINNITPTNVSASDSFQFIWHSPSKKKKNTHTIEENKAKEETEKSIILEKKKRKKNYSSKAVTMNFEEKRDRLRELRDLNVRRPWLVVSLGSALVEESGSKLGDEFYTVLEQVALASFDVGFASLADSCIAKLDAKFASSKRVQRLKAMQMESDGRSDEAARLYDELLSEEKNVGDEQLRKRRIAALKSRGDLNGAVDALCEYLSVFMADVEAWRELSELYVRLRRFKRAEFAAEELVLAQPDNFHNYVRLAEILYSRASADAFRAARDNYAYALELDSSAANLRAAIGLIVTLDALKTPAEAPLRKYAVGVVQQCYEQIDNANIASQLVHNSFAT
jgi:ER membrane protein complex subunit 2